MPEHTTGLRIVYFAHTIRSDWNNGNAHFLRGLVRALGTSGHLVTVFEPEHEWSIDNLRAEEHGARSLEAFNRIYADIQVSTYPSSVDEEDDSDIFWRQKLAGTQIVILHEWNPPALAQRLLDLRDQLGFRLLFHDTHHRASSSPQQMQRFGLQRFDGILAFGESLTNIYRERFGIKHVWTFHEAADTTVFHPLPTVEKSTDALWIGNWGEEERAAEIKEFYLTPAADLASRHSFLLYGVRYPQHALEALHTAHICYGGYLPNLDAPAAYAAARLTVHIPRQQYSSAMVGIPTIRVFEALASGIPLISAPWQDTEKLFRSGDFCMVQNTSEMIAAMQALLRDAPAAEAQAHRGLESILSRHTCMHRAQQLTTICKEVLT